MKDYILIVFITSVVISIIQYIGDSHGATKPYLFFITALVTLFVMLNPFLSVVRSMTDSITLPRIEEEKPEFQSGEDKLLSLAQKQLSLKINQMIQQEFGIIADTIIVDLKFDEEKIVFYIKKIEVIISDEDFQENIQTYLEETFDAKITVRCKEKTYAASG